MKLYIDRNNEKEYSKYINNEHELAIDERKVHMEENMIITISRQYGSGGSQVAKILAERIGNEELTEDTINDLNYKRNDVASAGITGVMGMGNIPIYNQMFLEQAKIIRKLANYGSAVFLGRCADYILKDIKNCTSVYLYADREFRKNRVKEIYGSNAEIMDKEEKNRADYYNYYTGNRWGDINNYDFAINTSKVSFEEAADLIYRFAKDKQKNLKDR